MKRKLIFFITLLSISSTNAYAQGVLLNEIMANPSDNTEWVELYNSSNEVIDLSDWKIKDGNTLINDDLTLTGQISPLSFVVLDHSKGWLNDSGNEIITLLNKNGEIVDTYSYSGTTKGKTYGRQPDGLDWIANLEPSKGTSNGSASTPSPSPTFTPSSSPNPTKTSSPTASPKKTSAPTSTPTPTPTPSPSPSPTPTATQKLAGISAAKITYRIASVAAATASSIASSSALPIEIKNKQQLNPFILIGLILIFAAVLGVSYIYLKRNAKIHFKFRSRN